jgi:hypothetical protein
MLSKILITIICIVCSIMVGKIAESRCCDE